MFQGAGAALGRDAQVLRVRGAGARCSAGQPTGDQPFLQLPKHYDRVQARAACGDERGGGAEGDAAQPGSAAVRPLARGARRGGDQGGRDGALPRHPPPPAQLAGARPRPRPRRSRVRALAVAERRRRRRRRRPQAAPRRGARLDLCVRALRRRQRRQVGKAGGGEVRFALPTCIIAVSTCLWGECARHTRAQSVE
uniref:Uncharacterized protein n=1 Tax=Emiliania huxleyi (strain CCMP1516) TaxID=280463 RepID=A0A0D3IES6_EMIH1